MSRPRQYSPDRVATAVRLPQSVHQQLHQVANERAVSANLLITRAVVEYLERLPDVSATTHTIEVESSTSLGDELATNASSRVGSAS